MPLGINERVVYRIRKDYEDFDIDQGMEYFNKLISLKENKGKTPFIKQNPESLELIFLDSKDSKFQEHQQKLVDKQFKKQ